MVHKAATDRLGQVWKAAVGHFSQAPKDQPEKSGRWSKGVWLDETSRRHFAKSKLRGL